ncbi:DNA repair protein RadA [Rhodohalobacter halophilus]|uniref:DNA repair protein RadA n=1 Tax=Rhodohalobacter halophilus TaxID=1812810 RepID=UPI00083F6A54|nr:DNA repair protein RadA [Rhodohalobacter halophilus]
MAKPKIQYECSACGHLSAKWLGLCPACGEWHTFEEKFTEKKSSSKKHKVDISNTESPDAVALSEVKQSKEERTSTNLVEFDRVLGGGVVDGSFLLLGGDPGIGKSTLMLQVAKERSDLKILYIAGEESASQIKQRAGRIGMSGENLLIYNNTDVRNVIDQARKIKPDILVVDSIQTVFSSELSSLPGSVQQIRECSAMFQQLAKKEGITTLMIGHVTKEGDIAGPRILEHMVDTVLHFEGDQSQLHRLLRGVKNRFGPANEVGVFEMRDTGLHEVINPSDLFLAEMNSDISGNCVTCIMEGSRPILIEIQALVTPSNYSTPQRTASGFDQRRLSLLIAVLEKRAAMGFAGQDVYLNVAGGLKINDTAADLAVVAALASSLKDTPIRDKSLYIGEVGLGGEVRRVPFLKQRLSEAEKMGFKNAVLPVSDTAGTFNMKLNPADHLMKALK